MTHCGVYMSVGHCYLPPISALAQHIMQVLDPTQGEIICMPYIAADIKAW